MQALAERSTDKAASSVPPNVYVERVLSVEHHTDRLFKFSITRPASFRFRSGEFVMIGLPDMESPLFRAYSLASPSWDEELEFFSIKVAGGPLTEHLQKIQVGDKMFMRKKSTGTLVNDALIPGKRLWMFSTGTGLAPFASLVRDPETYEKFDKIILTHTCREVAALRYGQELLERVKHDPLVGEFSHKLASYFSVTRQEYPYQGRITDLLSSGKLLEDLGEQEICPETDRAMICGSLNMITDMKKLLEGFGLTEGSNNRPASYVVERAFAS